MRTRTLLLLAVGCGLLILAAGVAQLLRLAATDDPPAAARVGERVVVGDLSVTVESFTERSGRATAIVALGGIDDPDGAAEFRLVVPGASLRPLDSGAALGDTAAADVPACAATSAATQRCALSFDVRAAPGSSRVLLYRRGDEQVRWELDAG